MWCHLCAPRLFVRMKARLGRLEHPLLALTSFYPLASQPSQKNQLQPLPVKLIQIPAVCLYQASSISHRVKCRLGEMLITPPRSTSSFLDTNLSITNLFKTKKNGSFENNGYCLIPDGLNQENEKQKPDLEFWSFLLKCVHSSDFPKRMLTLVAGESEFWV